VFVGSTPPPVTVLVPSSSGQDACLTHRIAQVRVLPGRLWRTGPQVLWRHASVVGRWSGFDPRADLWYTSPLMRSDRDSESQGFRISEARRGPLAHSSGIRHRGSEIGQDHWVHVWDGRMGCWSNSKTPALHAGATPAGFPRVRLPGGPPTNDGLMVQRNDAAFARRRSGFDSRWVH
jgi:hypothetical protein